MKTTSTRLRSVCFVSQTRQVESPLLDASVRYRCYHPAEALVAKGVFCSVYSSPQFFREPVLDFDVYVFHRPHMGNDAFAQVIKFLKKKDKVLIADYDDLIFGPEKYAIISSIVKNGVSSPKEAIEYFAHNLEAMLEFDRVTTSTEPLSTLVKELNPAAHVEVVPNALPRSLRMIHKKLKTHLYPRPSTTIGYFAGTKSHDHDLPIIEPVLHRILCENPDFSLLVIGPVAINPLLASLPNIRVGPAVPYNQLPEIMKNCATVVAPLENTIFNSCKSRVKFLEASLAGCRLIATPIPDMLTVGSEYMTLASTLDEWYEALSSIPDVSDAQAAAERNFNYLDVDSSASGIEVFWGSK